jgi:hypothetical protein
MWRGVPLTELVSLLLEHVGADTRVWLDVVFHDQRRHEAVAQAVRPGRPSPRSLLGLEGPWEPLLDPGEARGGPVRPRVGQGGPGRPRDQVGPVSLLGPSGPCEAQGTTAGISPVEAQGGFLRP